LHSRHFVFDDFGECFHFTSDHAQSACHCLHWLQRGNQLTDPVWCARNDENIEESVELAYFRRGHAAGENGRPRQAGPGRLVLQRQAAGSGLAHAAVFTGRVPAAKVRQFHALLDVFVIPRTPDRVCQLVTPLKPMEAMASGLCVVTSEVKALTEIVKHEVTGMQTVPQDPVSLADCLERLFYSPDIRRKLGDNAREWVSGDRTWARNAARYQDAYARLGAI
jgi:hypothetical protein